MKNKAFVTLMIVLLVGTYALTLVVSTRHLASLYSNYDPTFPLVALGLAVALELSAFLLSLASTALSGTVTPWASNGATFTLLLVWLGNAYRMYTADPSQPWWITVLLSCFVPVGTFVIGKVIGSLFKVREGLVADERRAKQEGVFGPERERLASELQLHLSQREASVTHLRREVAASSPAPVPPPAASTSGDWPVMELAPGREPDLNRATGPDLSGEVAELSGPPATTEQERVLPDFTHVEQAEPQPRADMSEDTFSGMDKMVTRTPEKADEPKSSTKNLSNLQRQLLSYLREHGPTSREQLAGLVNRTSGQIEASLVLMLSRNLILETDGVYQTSS